MRKESGEISNNENIDRKKLRKYLKKESKKNIFRIKLLQREWVLRNRLYQIG